MPDTRHRWLLVDLGGFRKAHWSPDLDAFRHPWACFTETGETDCVCGLSASRTRPVAPVLDAEAVA